MAFNQRLIVVQTPINAREKRKRKKRSFAHFVFNFCSFRFCDYNLMRKYTSMSLDETTVRSKLDDKDAIYLPIHEEELRVNPLLVQNRFYMASEDISKN